jgi:hypothetical protein
MTERRAPGEVRGRTLARPPGDRYLPPSPVAAPVRPDLRRATIFGAGAAIAFAVVAAILNAGLNLPAGVAIAAAPGGWLIGRAARLGAQAGRGRPLTRGPVGLAVILALLAWLAGEVAAYVLSLALLQESVRSLADRIAALPFLDWLGPQFGSLEILSLFLLAGFAWFGSR